MDKQRPDKRSTSSSCWVLSEIYAGDVMNNNNVTGPKMKHKHFHTSTLPHSGGQVVWCSVGVITNVSNLKLCEKKWFIWSKIVVVPSAQ